MCCNGTFFFIQYISNINRSIITLHWLVYKYILRDFYIINTFLSSVAKLVDPIKEIKIKIKI